MAEGILIPENVALGNHRLINFRNVGSRVRIINVGDG